MGTSPYTHLHKIFESVFKPINIFVLFLIAFWTRCAFLWLGGDSLFFIYAFDLLLVCVVSIFSYKKYNAKLNDLYMLVLVSMLFASIATLYSLTISALVFILLTILLLPVISLFRCDLYKITIVCTMVSFIVLMSVVNFLDYYIPRHPILSDSLDYLTWAKAISLHTSGNNVDSKIFLLQGLISANVTRWEPQQNYTYSEVFGTANYLYSVILHYALKLGFQLENFYLVQLSFIVTGLVAFVLFAINVLKNRMYGILLLAIFFFDVAYDSAAIVLWRESVAIYLISLILVGISLIFSRIDNIIDVKSIIVVSLASALLHSIKFVPFIVVYPTIIAASIVFYSKRSFLIAPILCVLIYFGSAIVDKPTNFQLVRHINNAVEKISLSFSIESSAVSSSINVKTLQDEHANTPKKSTIIISKPVSGAAVPLASPKDDSLYNWRLRLNERGYYGAFWDVVSATFFAPNPNWLRTTNSWQASKFYDVPEITYLYFSTSLFAILTPFIILSFRSLTDNKILLIPLCFLVAYTIIYIVFYGSMSGRQRIVVTPILTFFGVVGISNAVALLRSVFFRRIMTK